MNRKVLIGICAALCVLALGLTVFTITRTIGKKSGMPDADSGKSQSAPHEGKMSREEYSGMDSAVQSTEAADSSMGSKSDEFTPLSVDDSFEIEEGEGLAGAGG